MRGRRQKITGNHFFFKKILVLFRLFLLRVFVCEGCVLVPRLWRQRTIISLFSPFVSWELDLRSDQAFKHMNLLGPSSLSLWHMIVWESAVLLSCGSYRAISSHQAGLPVPLPTEPLSGAIHLFWNINVLLFRVSFNNIDFLDSSLLFSVK